MQLPQADRAYVDLAKLRDYCLSPCHPTGKHKARVFAAALGLGPQHAEWLRQQIRAAVLSAPARVRPALVHGRPYEVDIPVQSQGRTAWIRTAWIVRHGESFARLTTCYVL